MKTMGMFLLSDWAILSKGLVSNFPSVLLALLPWLLLTWCGEAGDERLNWSTPAAPMFLFACTLGMKMKHSTLALALLHLLWFFPLFARHWFPKTIVMRVTYVSFLLPSCPVRFPLFVPFSVAPLLFSCSRSLCLLRLFFSSFSPSVLPLFWVSFSLSFSPFRSLTVFLFSPCVHDLSLAFIKPENAMRSPPHNEVTDRLQE